MQDPHIEWQALMKTEPNTAPSLSLIQVRSPSSAVVGVKIDRRILKVFRTFLSDLALRCLEPLYKAAVFRTTIQALPHCTFIFPHADSSQTS